MRKQNSDKQKLIHRIKIIQGHLKAVEKMLDEDKYCVDIVHQSLAVQQALKKVDELLIENHINSCVISQIKSGDGDKAVKELIELYEKRS